MHELHVHVSYALAPFARPTTKMMGVLLKTVTKWKSGGGGVIGDPAPCPADNVKRDETAMTEMSEKSLLTGRRTKLLLGGRG